MGYSLVNFLWVTVYSESVFLKYSKVELRLIGLISGHFSNKIITRLWLYLSLIMPKDKYYQLFVISNEYFAAASILSLYCDNIEDSENMT